jgi:bacteriorhodopsin
VFADENGWAAIKNWKAARFIFLTVLVTISILTVVEIGLGFKHCYWGVVIAGLLKLAIYAVVTWFFNLDSIKRSFTRTR